MGMVLQIMSYTFWRAKPEPRLPPKETFRHVSHLLTFLWSIYILLREEHAVQHSFALSITRRSIYLDNDEWQRVLHIFSVGITRLIE